MKTKTIYYPQMIEKKIADASYIFIKENTEWIDGIYSKKAQKISRKAHLVNFENLNIIDEYISQLIVTSLSKIEGNFSLLGTYINYYRNGNDFAPMHSHTGQVQLIISLGATRKLIIGKKIFEMKSGDAIIFGGSQHEVPVEPEIENGRISIATFMLRM